MRLLLGGAMLLSFCHHCLGATASLTEESLVGSLSQPDPNLKAGFERIYAEKRWSDDGLGSGQGSTLEVTEITRSIIRSVVTKYGLRSMVDAPCGAMAWMPTALRDIKSDEPSFQYAGVDIVAPVVQGNKERFRNESSWMRFHTLDFSEQRLPMNYDLIFSRDALQHLPLQAVIKALEGFSKTQARFLLVGSYMSSGGNRDIGDVASELDTGSDVAAYYAINLTEEPFLLTGHQHIFDEHTQEIVPTEAPKSLLLYPVSYLKSVDFSDMKRRAVAMAKPVEASVVEPWDKDQLTDRHLQ